MWWMSIMRLVLLLLFEAWPVRSLGDAFTQFLCLILVNIAAYKS